MRPAILRLLIFLTVAIGGGSLVLFAYFLFFGAPWAFGIARSDAAALAWDALLCLVFFFQHSGMIRRSAKEHIARRIPATYHPALYSIASGVALLTLVLLWQPTDQFLFGLHGLRSLALGFSLSGWPWPASSGAVHSLRRV